jgi:hypothetical protein
MTARRMFRYVIPADSEPHVVRLSHGPVAVAAVAQAPAVEFWAECTEGTPQVRRAFQVFGTGHPLPEDAVWTGTCDRTPDGLVWHLFEVPAAEPWFPGGDPRDDDRAGGYRPGIEGD